MLYIYIEQHTIKVLQINKSLLGQYSVRHAEKNFSVQLLKNGRISHTDIVASAIKEVVSHLSPQPVKEKQAYLILPQDAFYFFRSEVPNDMAPSAVTSFVKEKARSILPPHLDSVFFDFVCTENENKKIISLYAVEEAVVSAYSETLKLVDLQLSSILPDTLAYYKLFEKTLRKGKIEHILYGLYEKDSISAYLYDSFGLLQKEAFREKLVEGKGVEEYLKKVGFDFEENHHKINRLILSGSMSENVRQDTFTKDVGIWTNPLKRILLHFYNEYVKMLVPQDNQPFPVLQFDVCFGALILSIENNKFSLVKNKFSPSLSVMAHQPFKQKRLSMPGIRIPKELLLFVVSFAGSFLLFTILTQSPVGFNMRFSSLHIAKPTVTPTKIPLPSPTPTPVVKRDTLKIKILNGSGTVGKASDVKTVLKDKGYLDVVTGNADTFDFTKTEVAIKKGSEHLFDAVQNDIVDYVQNPKQAVLDEKETADVVITVGKDFK